MFRSYFAKIKKKRELLVLVEHVLLKKFYGNSERKVEQETPL